jgi:hypothetical protein
MAERAFPATRSSAGLFRENVKIKTQSIPGEDPETIGRHLRQVLDQSLSVPPAHSFFRQLIQCPAVPKERLVRITRQRSSAGNAKRPMRTPVEIFTRNVLGGFNVKS